MPKVQSSETFHRYRLPDERMEPWPVSSEELHDGATMHGKVLYRSPDGTHAHGIWECTPGRITGKFITDEASVILEGSMTVVLDDGSSHDVKAGDLVLMEIGVGVEWIIHEKIKKAWNVYHPDGLPF